jgi:hypothetical protein
MSANIKASTDGTQAIIGVGGATTRQCQRLNTKVGWYGSVRMPNANMQLRW